MPLQERSFLASSIRLTPARFILGASLSLAACITEPPFPNAPSDPRPTLVLSRPVEATDTVPGRWVVVLRPGAANTLDARLDRLVPATALARPIRFRAALQGFAATLSDSALATTRRSPDVLWVEPVMRGYRTASAQSPVGNWGLDRIDQLISQMDNTFTYGVTGAGVRIYHIDSGIHYSDPEFGGRAVVGKDFVTAAGDASDCDTIKAGHGTATAGIVGSATYGVAKGVTLVSVKVVDCQDHVVDSDVLIEAIDWVTANAIHPAVVNYSISGPWSYAKNLAVTNSVNSGITWVVAAGNNNNDACNYSPGSAASAITVAASTSSDTRWDGTNTGWCVDIYAPGAGLFTTSLWTGVPTFNSGTSLAAPFVAGAAALYLEGHPTASASEVGNAIVSAAYSYAIVNPSNGFCCTTPKLLNIQWLYPNPGSLSVSISGKSSIKPNQTCTWRAQVQGASGTLQYRWKFNGMDLALAGEVDSLRTEIPSSGSLSVEVSTLGGTSLGTASKVITVASNGNTCVT